MRVEDVLQIGKEAVLEGPLPVGRGATRKAFDLGRKLASEAIYKAIDGSKRPYFWTVRPDK